MNKNLDPNKENYSAQELDIERALRPLSFDDFAGQEAVLENLKVFVKAANMRHEALDHTLFHGPPGLGKTTLAHILANELGVGIKIHSGRNRIVRRIFEHLGYQVEKLDRVVFAGLTKKDLPRGHWRRLTQQEVINLRNMK